MKRFFLFLIFLAATLFTTPSSFAVGELCANQNPTCCTPPQAVVDGGGCPVGQVWIGGQIAGLNDLVTPGGRCETPTACPGSTQFACATNTCFNPASACLNNRVATAANQPCCSAGQTAVFNGTEWRCQNFVQWDVNGEDVYYDGGFVGIGTNDPTDTLSLRGSFCAFSEEACPHETLTPGSGYFEDALVVEGDLYLIGRLRPRDDICEAGEFYQVRWDGALECSPGPGSSWSELYGNIARQTGRVGIGMDPTQSDATLHVLGSICADDDVNCISAPAGQVVARGITVADSVNANVSLNVVRDQSSASQTGAGYFFNQNGGTAATFYGAFAESWASAGGNTQTAYGLLAYSFNPSSVCAGPNCAQAYGVYASAQGTYWGQGVYGAGRYVGGHFEGLAGGPPGGSGVWGYQPNNSSFAVRGQCEDGLDTCLGGYFEGGGAAQVGTPGSGGLVVGDLAGNHLALDATQILAKSNGTTSGTLNLNTASNGDVTINLEHNSSSTSVCRIGETLAACSSLRELKKNIQPLTQGLGTIMQFRPVTFSWKNPRVNDGRQDLGLIAEEVAALNPLFAEYSEGTLSGVKYAQLSALLIKAVQELKAELDKKDARLQRLEETLHHLTPSL